MVFAVFYFWPNLQTVAHFGTNLASTYRNLCSPTTDTNRVSILVTHFLFPAGTPLTTTRCKLQNYRTVQNAYLLEADRAGLPKTKIRTKSASLLLGCRQTERGKRYDSSNSRLRLELHTQTERLWTSAFAAVC